MAKLRSKWSQSVYLRRLKEGRGTGTGINYKPWITIHDFASKGSVSRIPGRKTGRIQHFMSHLESDLFYILDNRKDVADIREQFPLRLSDTLNLSSCLGIRHPYLPGCDFPFVMTTDFLLTMSDGSYRAYSVKQSDDLGNKRTVEKLLLEKAYWDQKGVYWKVITEREINKDKSLNLRWLYYGDKIVDVISPALLSDCETCFLDLFQNASIPFPDILVIIEEAFTLAPGSGIALLKHLIQSEKIILPMEHRIDFSEPRKEGFFIG